MTRLALRAPDARVVELAGDFTEWKFVAASRAANGVWYADLRIPPGQYRYAFRIDGTDWLVPDGATAVDDGFGGKSAWITVPGRNVGR
jgi:1,4-alpha-glucan branching enzyme